MNALGLLRVSTADQAESGFSLPDQESAIRAYCQRNGIPLADVLADDGVSGRMSERPAVKRALELARAGLISRVILVKVDRMGRENRVIQNLLGRFRDLGIRVEFVEHGAGDTPEQRLNLNVLGAISEYELEQIRARTMAGRRRKAESGRMPVAFNLLGFTLVRRWQEEAGQGQSGEIQVNEAEAETVRELFARYAGGESLSQLVKWLNGAGVRTRRGNEWRVTTLRLTLQNPAYVGLARYGHRSVTSYIDGEKKRFRVEAQPEWVTVPCPAIVEPEIWAQAQARLKSTAAQFPGRPSADYLLSGCVECETCRGKRGAPTKAVGQRKSRNNVRPAYLVRSYVCPGCNASLAAELWERKALKWLLAQLTPGIQGEAIRAQLERERRDADGGAERIARLADELTALQQDERQLLEVALHFSPSLVAEKAGELRGKRERSERALAELRAQQKKAESPEAIVAEVERRAEALRARLMDATPADLKRTFRLHLRIILRKGRRPKLLFTL